MNAIDTNVLIYAHDSRDPQKQTAAVSLIQSFWDALIIAACRDSGVNRLYTEDFDAYPVVNGLEVVNPFVPTP